MNEICVVGIGPGKKEGMTFEAAEALKNSDTIIGYTTYIELVRPLFPEKEYLSTAMTREQERCRMAFEEAARGKKVSLVCSGDSGIYGMASLMYKTGEDFPGITVRIIPGVTAAVSGAAVLGAPLSNDFCVISLSDYLTPEETIRKRLQAAARGDFVIVLYNPSSHKRPDYLRKACQLLLNYRSRDTVCGIVRNIGREGESSEVTTLEKLCDIRADMFTTVFIGNQSTTALGKKMITPRGYRHAI
ncbi:MAG: precorrin-3B C(17)-methyltransferase [Eubacteriales bacterium]